MPACCALGEVVWRLYICSWLDRKLARRAARLVPEQMDRVVGFPARVRSFTHSFHTHLSRALLLVVARVDIVEPSVYGLVTCKGTGTSACHSCVSASVAAQKRALTHPRSGITLRSLLLA